MNARFGVTLANASTGARSLSLTGPNPVSMLPYCSFLAQARYLRECTAGKTPAGSRKVEVMTATRQIPSTDAEDQDHSSDILPLVYSALRRLARSRMAREGPGRTLQPTALVHEAYLRLEKDGLARWDGRGHFFAAAAEAMRRILVERARRAGTIKHGGHLERATYDEATIPD